MRKSPKFSPEVQERAVRMVSAYFSQAEFDRQLKT